MLKNTEQQTTISIKKNNINIATFIKKFTKAQIRYKKAKIYKNY